MKKSLISISFLVFMAGCGPATIQGLRDNPAGVVTFEVDSNYQVVYRKVITQARSRHQGQLMFVNGDCFLDQPEANIIVHYSAVYLGIDIKAISDNRTKVTTYYAFNAWKNAALEVQQWCTDLNSQ